MSDKDLIKRGDVINVICEMHVGGKDAIEHALPNTYAEDLREIIYEVDDIPAVPHEMSAREYLQTHDRFVAWCTNQPCSRCNYRHGSCLMSLAITPEQRVADMQKWAREHPERSEE